MKAFIVTVMALGALCAACDDNEGALTETEEEEQAEGVWLKYWSGPQPVRLNLGVDYYAVHFTKPEGWAGVRIDSVEIVSASDGGQISLSFWAASDLEAGAYWPSDPPTQTAPRTVASGGNAWDVTEYEWVTTAAEFFVGLQQGDVITLTSDGRAEPEVRSYRKYETQAWEQEWAMFSNYCIGIFVTPAP